MNAKYLPTVAPFGVALIELDVCLRRSGLSENTRLNYCRSVGRALASISADDPEAWRERMADRGRVAAYVAALSPSSLSMFGVAWQRWRIEWPSAAVWSATRDVAAWPVASPSEAVPDAVVALWRVLATRLAAKDIALLTISDVEMRGYALTLDGEPMHQVTVKAKDGKAATRYCAVPRSVIAPVVRRALHDGETWPASDRPLTGRYPGASEPYPIGLVKAYTTGVERFRV